VTAVAVTGLRAEAEIARRAGLVAVCAGGVPARTAEAVERAIADGASFLLSFGIAGGLDPRLRPGTLVSAGIVVDDEGEAIGAAALPVAGAVRGTVCGAAKIVATEAAKSALHAATGALCVDLESHVIARAARRAGLPFGVLRAVADPADRALPPAALLDLKPDGTPALASVLRSVAGDPRQIGSLIRTALDTRAALRSLSRAKLADIARRAGAAG
jgi:adenosylhomocysteine nucleosidase